MLILGFILGKLKKVTRWHCCWKILKRLIKVVITPLLSQLQGWPGWQMNGTMLRYLDLVVFCARIEPKMEKIRKTIRKQGFFDDLLSILTVFWSLLNFGSILAQKLNRFICKKKNWIFWHPGHPCESSGVGKIRALSDTVLYRYIFLRACMHWRRIFFSQHYMLYLKFNSFFITQFLK